MSVDVSRFDDVNGDSNLMCDRVPAGRFLVERSVKFGRGSLLSTLYIRS